MKYILILFVSFFSLVANAEYKNISTYEEHRSHLKEAMVDGHKIAYLDEGSGKPILLVHGIPTNSWMYRKLVPILVDRGFRVIAPDLLGFGASEKNLDAKSIGLKSQARALIGLMKKLSVNNWSQVLHDFGGPITWEMSEMEGFNVNELIVLNTFAYEDGWKSGLNSLTKMLMGVATTKPLEKSFYSTAIKSMLFDPNEFEKNELSELIHGYVQPLIDGASCSYKSLYFSANKLKLELPRYQADLTRLSKIPTKIIWGKYDKFLSSDQQLRQIKGALKTLDQDVLVLKNSKHLITEDSSNEIADFITGKSNKNQACGESITEQGVNNLVESVRNQYFPNLAALNIEIRKFKSDSYYLQAKIDPKTLIQGKHDRRYYIEINPSLFDCSPSYSALQAILVHEFEHISDYNSMSSGEIVKLGIDYASSKIFRAKYERSTDEKALKKGVAQGLIDYRLWIYERLSPAQLKLKKRYYFTPDEILEWLNGV